MHFISNKNYRAIAIIAVLAIVLYLPMLNDYFHILARKDYYQVWPLWAVILPILYWRRWKISPKIILDERVSPPKWFMVCLFFAAIVLMLFALVYFTPWVAAVSWITFTAIGALYLGSLRKIENLFGLWVLLLFFIRPPYQVSLRIMTWMENISAKSATLVLDYASILHRVQGNVLALPGHDFDIDAICSGWVSLISMLAVASLISVSRNRRLFHVCILLLLAVFSTWILNVLRMLAVVSVKIWFDFNLLSGVYEVFFQVISFLIGFVLILSADSLIHFLIGRNDDQYVQKTAEVKIAGFLPRIWKRATEFSFCRIWQWIKLPSFRRLKGIESATVIAVILALITLEGVVFYYRPMIEKKKFMHGEDELIKVSEEAVLFNRDGWEVVEFKEVKRDFSNIWGALSSIWKLKYNDVIVVMALDYPFDDWHDVKNCYLNLGWKIESERIEESSPIFDWGASETNMILPNGNAGFVLCSHCDHLGNSVQPKPTDHDHTMLIYRLHPNLMTAPFGTALEKDKRTFYQTQTMVNTQRRLDEATKREIRLMYAQFREQTRRAIEMRSRQN